MLGADFNTNLDGNIYRGATSIKAKSKRELLVHKAKASALKKFIGKYNLVDTCRHIKNRDSDKVGYTFNLRKVNTNTSMIDYILI